MRRISLLTIVMTVLAGSLLADTVSDVLRADLARERRRLAVDASQLADVGRRLDTATGDLATASRAVTDLAARADSSVDEIARREDAVASAEQEVRSLLDRRRLLVERLLERRRSVALLEAELRGKRPASAAPDLLSGRWNVALDPGEQRGVFRLALDGTLVSGEYTIEGGFSGSLRGTLIGDRLRLERVDSQLGFTTIYYGRLARDGREISGTWESTTFGVGAAGAGRWRAQPIKEEEPEASP
ncbi:MAG TPA: hypothetical protein VFW81_05040 [Thermoanaerobaculia bacterium]|nr:hypothetical protein [Thermoanaerobaculia bacterium]